MYREAVSVIESAEITARKQRHCVNALLIQRNTELKKRSSWKKMHTITADVTKQHETLQKQTAQEFGVAK